MTEKRVVQEGTSRSGKGLAASCNPAFSQNWKALRAEALSIKLYPLDD